MIEAIKGKGVNRAKVVCDDCGRDDTVTCGYIPTTPHTSEPNKSQVLRKIESGGWAEVKGKLRCPSCEARRKAHQPKEEDMTVAEKKPADDLRQPDRRQKREIIGMLELVYDDEKKRYKDGENDRTVAEAVDGALWGWVAAIREELFGPDTRNQEIEDMQGKLNRLDGMIGAFKGEAAKAITAMEAVAADIRKQLAGLLK